MDRALCRPGQPELRRRAELHRPARELRAKPVSSAGSIRDHHQRRTERHDGMPDFWETAKGLIPFSNDANDDYDGDGSSNLQEYLAGTNPLDARSYLSLDVARAADGVHLRFGAVAGRSYSVQYRDVVQADP